MTLLPAASVDSRFEIRALTGLRGVAALVVMAFHYWYWDWVPITTFSGHIAARGYISVDPFFILSGLVMSRAYASRFIGPFDWSSYVRFLQRRAARIYPIYAVLLMFGVVASLARPSYFPPLTLPNVLLNAGLVQSWFNHHSIVGTAWSLSTECAAYIAFPALVWVVLRGTPSAAACTCGAAAGLILVVWAYEVSLGRSPTLALNEAGGIVTPFSRCFGGFIIGMGVFRLAGSPAMAWAGRDGFGAAVIAVLAMFWIVPGTPDVLLYACLPCLILCLTLNRGRLGVALGSRPVWLLGEWSYSIYLTHIFMIHNRQRLFDHLARHMPAPWADTLDALVFYGVTIALAAACYKVIEVPARTYLVRRIALSVHRGGRAVAALATAPATP